ncbi:MAG TPA: DUF4236 domain-containing protein [Bacteroidales bacterium]|nr:DUF4236 domain-containing protein [Bacteroidales bacterium]
MRFRKSIRIAKGVRVNLSGSGFSLSGGIKGASMTIGKSGTYINTGIPGTGLYNRQKLGGGATTRSGSSYSHSGYDLSNYNIYINLDEKANPIISVYNNQGNEVYDEALIRKIKRDESYKIRVEELMNEKRDSVEKELAEFVDVFKNTPKMLSSEEIKNELNNLQIITYQVKEFQEKKPTKYDVTKILELESKKKIKTILFWKIAKLREDYINSNVDARMEEAHLKWSQRKSDFDNQEQQLENRFNQYHKDLYDSRKNELEGYLAGDTQFINFQIEKILNSLIVPVDFSIDFEYRSDNGTLFIDLNLPEIEDLPITKVNTLSSGKISIKDKTKKEIQVDYLKCVTGLAFYFGGVFFNISEKIKFISISGYTQRISKSTGNLEDEYIYSVIFDRERFMMINFVNIDPYEALKRFENRISVTSNFDLKKIEAFV